MARPRPRLHRPMREDLHDGHTLFAVAFIAALALIAGAALIECLTALA